MKLRAVISVLLLATLSACTVGMEYAPPDVSMPAAWADAHSANAAGDFRLETWWRVFDDPQLERLMARAAERNLDLAVAEARIRESRALRGVTAAAALPEVSAGGQFGRTQRSESVAPFKDGSNANNPFGSRTQNLFEIGWDAAWEVDIFGGTRRDKEAAVAQVQADIEARQDVLVTLLAEVGRAYVELRFTQRELFLLDETLRSRRETLDLIRARARAGLGHDLDVARGEELLATASARRPLLATRTAEIIHRLSTLVGEHPDALMPELTAPSSFSSPPAAIPATLPSELLSRRPDLRRAERELAAATARSGVARADLFPRFVILGSFGRRSEELADIGVAQSQFGGVIAGARWPILSGGRIRANIRAHDARQEQAARLYEKAILNALREVADSLVRHAGERQREESLRSAVRSASEALTIALARYRGGLDDYLSVLDAQRSLYAAEQSVVQSERDVSLALIAVYKALGGGWPARQTEETEHEQR